MKLEQYLETVSEQIRCTKIRSDITEELKNHILDQAESYEAQGAFPEEALERAVREMGDPVETGVALDRIHRPSMNWGLMTAVGLISILSIIPVYFANQRAFDGFSWQQQTMYVVLGFLAMLLVCHIDYSILEKWGKKAAAAFLLLIILGYLTNGTEINGAKRWIDLYFADISISEAMLLYVPLFGAVLYSYRGDGYKVFLKLIPWIFIPVYFVFRLPDLSAALILFACLYCMVLFTVWKGWYQVNKKAVLAGLTVLIVLLPFLFIGSIYLTGAAYQIARLEMLFTGQETYMSSLVRAIRENSAMIGSSREAVELFASGPSTEYLTDFILISMCSIYGSFAVIAIVAGFLLMILKIFQICITQKNQLGMIVGWGCGLVFLLKTVCSVLTNLNLIPYTSVSMPFLSCGGSGMIVSYCLLGLVLSIYRYKNILPDRSKKSRESAA